MELGERATAIVATRLAAKAPSRSQYAAEGCGTPESAAYWSTRGERERAVLEVRNAMLERQMAQEHDRAELVERRLVERRATRKVAKPARRTQFGSAYVRR